MRVEACEGDSGPRQHMNLPMVTHSKEAKRGAAPDGGPQLVWDMAVNPNAAAAAARNHRILDTMAIMVSTVAMSVLQALSMCKARPEISMAAKR